MKQMYFFWIGNVMYYKVKGFDCYLYKQMLRQKICDIYYNVNNIKYL